MVTAFDYNLWHRLYVRISALLWCGIGGSTIVMLFEKGVVEWDEDLLINGQASLETLVRVGMGIGRRVGVPTDAPNPPPKP